MANNIIDFLENTDIPDMIKILKANNILQNNNIVKHKYQHGGNYLYYNIPGNNIDSWQNMNISPWYNTPWQNQYYNIEDEKNTIIFLANIYKALKEANDKKQDSKDTATTNCLNIAQRTDDTKWTAPAARTDNVIDELPRYIDEHTSINIEELFESDHNINKIFPSIINIINENSNLFNDTHFCQSMRNLNSQENHLKFVIITYIMTVMIRVLLKTINIADVKKINSLDELLQRYLIEDVYIELKSIIEEIATKKGTLEWIPENYLE